jgi:hypothetical protein
MRCGWAAYEVVRPMISRVRAGGLVAIFCVGVVLVPGETFGRGGSVGGRSFAVRSFGSGFRPPALRQQAQLHPHHQGFGPQRRRLGFGFYPFAGYGGGYYDSGYGPFDYVEPSGQPVAAEPETTGAIPPPPYPYPGAGLRPLMAYRPGCTTQTVTVPSETGGESSINIVRC